MVQIKQGSFRASFWHIPVSLLTGVAIGVFITYIGVGDTLDATKHMLLWSETSAIIDKSYASSNGNVIESAEDINGKSGTGSSALSSKPVSQRDFLELSYHHRTDKTRGTMTLAGCLKDPRRCKSDWADAKNPKCRVYGHYYDSLYQRWLGPYSTDDAEPFQFLEVGFYHGQGFDTYSEFLPNAEKHSIEISCLPPGARNEGKWPWGNFASKNKNYQSLLDAQRLHCIDGSKYNELKRVWDTEMKRPDAPALKVVVDDGSHLAEHMAMSLFFWLPRIAPGGLMFVEDIESYTTAARFRKELLPQIIKDVHWCGLPSENGKDMRCFPTLQPLIKSIHCEMHICVFERNDLPAIEYDETDSSPPSNALNSKLCTL